MKIEHIKQIKGIKANGQYSPAVVHNGIVYLSGQFAIDPETGERRFGTVAEEADQVIRNIGVILNEAGSGLDRVLKCCVYIKNIEDWDAVNAVYAKYFPDDCPARTVITAKDLHFGFKVEMDVIAAKDV